jgi:hypothetical protein
MAKPVQRLPRYILSIKDLLKETVPGHPDFVAIQLCLSTMTTFAESLDNHLEGRTKSPVMNNTVCNKRMPMVDSPKKDLY